MTADRFDDLMAALDAPMTVVTAAVAEERAGCLVGFHAQASIEPARYCVWISKANHTYRVALRASHLAVHLLAREDLDLAELFGTLSGDRVDKFAVAAAGAGPGGAPLLERCPNRLVLRRVSVGDDGGDHVAVTGEPVLAETAGPFEPLRLSQVSGLTPGHDNAERR